ncbi:MAG: hypothetical protein ACLP5H_21685 [Desulfomonilaceae bacterium]
MAVVISTQASYVTGKWHWFGRSGGIITMMGVLLTVRPLVRMGVTKWFNSQRVIDGGGAAPTPEEVEEERQLKLDAKATQIGVIMALVGAVIWAYGDLIGGLP